MPRTVKVHNPADTTEEVVIHEGYPEQRVKIGTALDTNEREALIQILKDHKASFAWEAKDMPGINLEVISHELHVDASFKPIKQKRRKLGPERAKAVNDEVDKLLAIGSIREVKYPDWLANPVVVKKKNGKWRVCVDFTDLNKACPKDSFPLPHIDRLVESTAGHERLSFMDAYSGYNQIMMSPEDQEKTSFITDRGIYCYKVMPFGLKNAGATYQRLVNKMFDGLLGKTMEVYIDDMLVKSLKASDHVSHLLQCFEILNKFGMKLNPAKCTFGVPSGEFLGYIVTERGIEANPTQINAFLKMPSPRNIKEVQQLTGRIAALNRFISRSTDKSLPFYQLLKGNKQFIWDDKCEEAFSKLKEYLTTPPVLSKPEFEEKLYLYVSVSTHSVSGVLVRDDRGEQKPIYYVSKTLLDAETRYSMMEKLALAVVMSARKLRPYFQSHQIEVLTSHPLRTILHSPGQSGRLAKWAIELSEYDIEYKGRASAKAQVLADFLTELPPTSTDGSVPENMWRLHVDGSSSKHGSGIGLRLIAPGREVIEQSFRLIFPASNNEAEYEALIAGMRLATSMNAEELTVYCDSQLVVNQFNGDYEAKDQRMEAYLHLVKNLAANFKYFELIRIPRSENTSADALAALASTSDPDLKRIIPVESIVSPSISIKDQITVVTRSKFRANPDSRTESLPNKRARKNSVRQKSVEELPEEPKSCEVNEEVGITEESEVDTSDLAPEPKQQPREIQIDTLPGVWGSDWRIPITRYIEFGELPEGKWKARKLRIQSAKYCLIRGALYRRGLSDPYLLCIHGEETYVVMAETHEGLCGSHSSGRTMAFKIKRQGFFWPTR